VVEARIVTDVLLTLWVASVAAAICFFAAGVATHSAIARRRMATRAVDDAAPVVDTQARTERAEARCAELEHALAHATESLRGESARAQSIGDELRTLQAAAQSLVPAGVVEALRHQLAEAQRRVAADAAAQRRSLVSAEARAKKIETELEAARARITTMSSELDAARAAKLPARTSAPKRSPARPRPTAAAKDTVELNLNAQLGSLASECGYDVVVLSDAQGLLLAGVGDEQTQGTIAALSSVARELTTRAAEFVELRPKLIEVTGDGGRSLRIRLFQWEQEPIALASFGVGHTEPTREEDTVITVFPAVMAS
jgi:hypothetical protein